MLKLKDIRIRDPFILFENGVYYMYGTTNFSDGIGADDKFSVYVSHDLVDFDDPKVIFDGKKQAFWADRDYWAAEMHKYNGNYYLFGSISSEERKRCTQIFICDRPDGTFVPLSEKARTPYDWQCLDGTLYVEKGTPYMVFCREWTEIGDGAIYAVELKGDLTDTVGEPFLLFKAGDNPLVESINVNGKVGKVTDGPFLFRENGRVKMIWSSFVSGGKYAILEAEADDIKGKWVHKKCLFSFEGGHAMVFMTEDGKRYFALHSPNTPQLERATFIEYRNID